jgi:hypothetical protein
MDFDSIPFGADFREQIRETVERARVVIAIIGPHWAGERAEGGRRIDQPTDVVRFEIATALAHKIPVIPVLVGKTPMPKVDDLPEDLKGLAYRNALALDPGVDFHFHVDRLISSIREFVKDSPPSEPVAAENAASATSSPPPPSPAPPPPPPATVVAGKTAPSPSTSRKKIFFIVLGTLVFLAALNGSWYFYYLTRQSKHSAETPTGTPTPAPTTTPGPVIAAIPSAGPTMATPTVPPVTNPAPANRPITMATPNWYVPSPTPPNNTINDEEVRAFVISHYRATERKDLAELLSHYDYRVDYQKDGWHDKAFIQNGYLRYFNRWPSISFDVGNIKVVHSAAPDTVTAYVETHFVVRNDAEHRTNQGTTDEQWTIVRRIGALRIASEKQNVHNESSERHRTRRH